MTATGLEILLSDPRICLGRRIGLMVNQSSLTASLEYSWEALAKKRGKDRAHFFHPSTASSLPSRTR